MARRRMIDPNIWASEDMAKLTIRQRLLVIGLFSNADDHGKGIAKPAYIRSTVFPYDDIPISEIIDDLEAIRAVISIQFYEVKGNSYYRFINWLKWQTVQKPQPSIIPDPVENDSGMIPEPFSPKGKEKKGKEEGKEEKGREVLAPDSNPHKDRLHQLINQCKIQEYSLYDLDEIFSYIGVVDLEVIEAAIKKGQGKHVNYTKNTLKGFLKDGITKKEHLFQKPVTGERVVTPFPNRQKPKLGIIKDIPKSEPLSDEQLREVYRNAFRKDGIEPTEEQLDEKIRLAKERRTGAAIP